MRLVSRPVVCDRVRAQISLGLDGELSQLEQRMLASHVARCADCAAYEADVVAITTELRAAPLEALEHPVVVRRPRRLPLVRLQVGVAAGLAVAVLGALTQIALRDSEPAFASPEKYATSTQLTREVNQIIADGRAFSRQGLAMTL